MEIETKLTFLFLRVLDHYYQQPYENQESSKEDNSKYITIIYNKSKYYNLIQKEILKKKKELNDLNKVFAFYFLRIAILNKQNILLFFFICSKLVRKKHLSNNLMYFLLAFNLYQNARLEIKSKRYQLQKEKRDLINLYNNKSNNASKNGYQTE